MVPDTLFPLLQSLTFRRPSAVLSSRPTSAIRPKVSILAAFSKYTTYTSNPQRSTYVSIDPIDNHQLLWFSPADVDVRSARRACERSVERSITSPLRRAKQRRECDRCRILASAHEGKKRGLSLCLGGGCLAASWSTKSLLMS